MKSDSNQEAWNKTARRLARRMNTGFWLSGFLPLLLAAGIGQSFLLVWLRRNEYGSALSWVVFAALLVAAAAFAWYQQRGRFFSRRDALVYLESRLGLNNGLTAADSGVAEWPESPRIPKQALPHWSWKQIAPWPAWTLAVMALAGWLPLTPATSTQAGPPLEPTAWSGIEAWIETLEETEIFEEAALKDFREQIEALRRQDPENWYNHNSLETTDALRQRTERAIRELQENLEKASRAIEFAAEFPGGLPSGWESALREELMDAIAGLEEGLLRLDPELLAQLNDLDIESLPMMSEFDLKELRELLADGLRACGTCLGACEPCLDGEGECLGGSCPAGSGALLLAGSGGIGKGPAPAPLTFREERTADEVSTFESVRNEDLSRAALGDRVGVGQAEERDDDRAPYLGPTGAGAITTPGTGGETVSRQDFTPSEQAVLERYFQ